jgi:hypothetical protein
LNASRSVEQLRECAEQPAVDLLDSTLIASALAKVRLTFSEIDVSVARSRPMSDGPRRGCANSAAYAKPSICSADRICAPHVVGRALTCLWRDEKLFGGNERSRSLMAGLEVLLRREGVPPSRRVYSSRLPPSFEGGVARGLMRAAEVEEAPDIQGMLGLVLERGMPALV